MENFLITQRDLYMEKLMRLADNDNIVFVVGVRRSGKSCIAAQLEERLRERTREDEKIVRYNFETTDAQRVTADAMIVSFQKYHVAGQKHYIILDELLHVNDWEDAINFFSANRDCKLFVFSSNRRIISDSLSAVKEKRFDVVEVLPLSLPEFLSFQGFKEVTPDHTPLLEKEYVRFDEKRYTISEIYRFYIIYGGLPILKPEYMDIERARVITDGSYGAIVTRDILELGSCSSLAAVTDPILLRSVISIMAKSIGDNISATWVGKQTAEYLRRPSATRTIENYIRALLNAHLFYVAERYDIRTGLKMKTMDKYYIVDASLHNYITGVHAEDEQRLLENKVFFELIRRGYSVFNGKLGRDEIQLVAVDERGKLYIQVVDELTDQNETDVLSPLRRIRDSHPKIVIVFHGNSMVTGDGIIILNALEFLMGNPVTR